MIEDYHGLKPSEKQPPTDLGEGKTKDFPPLDPKGKYVKSTRIRCGRKIDGYPFNPLLSEDDYIMMEKKMKDALATLKDKELQVSWGEFLGRSLGNFWREILILPKNG